MSRSFVNLSITLTENVSDAARRLLQVEGAVGYKIAGTGIVEEVINHLEKRDELPNRNNWPKTHFHLRASKQTFLRSTNFDATVHIAMVGFRTYFGGTPEEIRPVKAKMLTIPARAEAYGRRAREFSDLVVRMVDNGRGQMVPALVRAEQTTFAFGRKRKDGTRGVKDKQYVAGGEVYFWLARVVHPKPHPEALPTVDKLRARAVHELESYVANL